MRCSSLVTPASSPVLAAFSLERVNQCRLAHIGDAANENTHGLGHTAPVGRQLMAGLNQSLGGRHHAGIKANGFDIGHGVVMRKPQGCAVWIGQILFA